jgi:hypothetical protein
MIAKIVKGQGFRGVVNYVLNQEKKTEILDSDGVMLDDPEAIIESFNFQTELNPRILKPVGHISLFSTGSGKAIKRINGSNSQRLHEPDGN